jgi:cysteine desulfurase/selenocysteine lyase|tara:strand:+ start:578 stop:1804 length:1227 start_codon:yes stop_codon:yes gene_type:complete
LNYKSFDVNKVREDFPILSRKVNGNKIIYFDNAATSQTPIKVIDVISEYYKKYNANIHRGVHSLSQEATDAFENSRKTIKNHFNSKETCEIIFTSGATHGINIVSSGYSKILNENDELLVSEMEHHSNIVPWQMLCQLTGAKLKVIPMSIKGDLEIDEFEKLLTSKTKLVFLNHVSNAIGTINPIDYIIKKAHSIGAKVLIDGTQASPHIKTDLQKLDIDYYVTSAHKMCGPTGIGFLYGKKSLLNKLPPYQGGGEMISDVTFEKTTYADLPHKFEAGTPNISGVIAFGEAINYMNNIGFDNILNYEKELLNYAQDQIRKIEGVEIYGDSINKTPIVSFNIKGIHPYDIGSILDKMGIAVRTGHHCAQPIMDFYKIPGTVRASFSFYNTIEEIDLMIKGLKKAIMMLQ